MVALLHPSYFPNILTFAVIIQKQIRWEVEDNYQKQTFRNRCHICTDKGMHKLSIPIKHTGAAQGRQKYKDVCIDNEYQWRRQHWRGLQTAYRTSPFFEFYEDDIAPIYTKTPQKLLDFNFTTIETVLRCMDLPFPSNTTKTYQPVAEEYFDVRFLVNAKQEPKDPIPKYHQVFHDKHGFLSNMSILDLLFNEGPNTLSYLEDLHLNYFDV